MSEKKKEKTTAVSVYGSYGRDKFGRRIRKKFTGKTEAEALLKKLNGET